MMRYVIIVILRLYQYLVSPLFVGLGVRCRFHPSCSSYALKAVRCHGVVKGLLFSIIRLSHCHPLSKRCGFDPVPPHGSSGESMPKADIDVSL